jgi:hypothetical protein
MHDKLGDFPWDWRNELSAPDPLVSTAPSVRTSCVVGSAEVVRQDDASVSSPVHSQLKLPSKPFALLVWEVLRAFVVIGQHLPHHGFNIRKGCEAVGHTDARVV